MRDCGVSGDSDHTYLFGPALKLCTIAWHLSYVNVHEEHIKSFVRTVSSIDHYTKCTVEFEHSKIMLFPIIPTSPLHKGKSPGNPGQY